MAVARGVAAAAADHPRREVWALNGRRLDPAAVLHVPAFLLPGEAVGLSPITQFATTIDAGLHADRAVSEWYASGTVPGQHLKNSARTLTPAEAAVMKARFKATMTTGEPFVTGADWTLDQVGFRPLMRSSSTLFGRMRRKSRRSSVFRRRRSAAKPDRR